MVTWEVDKHLEGTSFHTVDYGYKAQSVQIKSWVAYWKHKTGKEAPKYCPGRKDINEKDAHELTNTNVVGAHVRLKRKHGDGRSDIRYGIVPACRSCNTGGFPLVWCCEAVTVENPSTREFVGKINLNDGKTYWKEIDMVGDVVIKDEDGKGSGTTRKRNVRRNANNEEIGIFIQGRDNKNREKQCKYRDADDFLHWLSIYMKGNLGAIKKIQDDESFPAEIVMCNEGLFPHNKDEYTAKEAPEKVPAKEEETDLVPAGTANEAAEKVPAREEETDLVERLASLHVNECAVKGVGRKLGAEAPT